MKLKHKLPLVAEIPHLSLTDEELMESQNLVKRLETEFVSVLEANKQLCGIHHILAKEAYSNFFQIALTDNKNNLEEISLNQCEILHNNFQTDKPIQSLKIKKSVVNDNDSPFNELNYIEKTEIYMANKNFLDKIFKKFLGIPTRTRLVKLKAGTTVAPHIDYDPSYATRIIIPIIASEDCLNIFWEKNEIKTFTLQQGKAYFLNTGYKHAVVNLGKTDRYTFLISVLGTHDINQFIKK